MSVERTKRRRLAKATIKPGLLATVVPFSEKAPRGSRRGKPSAWRRIKAA